MNKWGVPNWLEEKVKKRDKFCIYCHVKFKKYLQTKGTPSNKATWEHIDNDGLPSKKNIALCCTSCNASKGTKKLSDWLESPYCKRKNISRKTIASIAEKSL